MTRSALRTGFAAVIAGTVIFLAWLFLPWILAAEVGVLPR